MGNGELILSFWGMKIRKQALLPAWLGKQLSEAWQVCQA